MILDRDFDIEITEEDRRGMGLLVGGRRVLNNPLRAKCGTKLITRSSSGAVSVYFGIFEEDEIK